MYKKNVIITDIKYRMAISPIRELAKKGHKIIGAEFKNTKKRERLGHFSRFTAEKALLGNDADSFLADMTTLCKNSRPVLLPVNRRSLTFVSQRAAEYEKICDFLVPSPDVIELADDKDKICSAAKELGIPVPKTTSKREHSSLFEMAGAVSFPAIIKYRNGEGMGLKPFQRYSIVNNKKDLISEYERMDKISENPIVSDYIKGHDIGVAAVCSKDHEIVDFICYESLSEYPLSGGPTCSLRTIYNDKLVKYAAKLLKEIKFTGIAMLDFRGTAEEAYFLEINPRVWGSAAITYLSGSSFFESYVKAASGEKLPALGNDSPPGYRLGAKMRFTPQTFMAFWGNLKKKKKLPVLMRYIRSFFDLSVHDGLFMLSDPMPYIHYIINLIKK